MSGLNLILGAIFVLIPLGIGAMLVWALLESLGTHNWELLGMTLLAILAPIFTFTQPENRR